MKIIITGNMGYIGSVLVPYIIKEGHKAIGIDSGLFPSIMNIANKSQVLQICKDIRDINKTDIKGADVVIHLAALSNDPSANLNPQLTEEINYKATVRLAEISKSIGVSRFLFSSSCSVYGNSRGKIVTEESICSPLSTYALSKLRAEKELLRLQNRKFNITILRNATVFGPSPRMRLDLVVNNMVAHGVAFKHVSLLSRGISWRPLLHIEDLANVFSCMITEDSSTIGGEIFNVGSNSENYRVKDVAKTVGKKLNVPIKIKKDAPKDRRSYKVEFSKIKKLTSLRIRRSLDDGISDVHKFLKNIDFNDKLFYNSAFYNIKFLQELMHTSKMTNDLRLRNGSPEKTFL